MLTTGMTVADAAWVPASVVVSGALVRLILALVAAHAARKALGPVGGSGAADRLRAHRLAVLRAILNGLRKPRR
ncbi:hypothetical protein [Streptomyces sp. WMMB 322]|uniref:hypothetical protein n=1 Tax=Streptomyces sp. WMMB 322 TaxID=1286821 RepID=UPI000823E42F|nr:hypothetical protein [Streptomyces sp. WMMB 322]SCK17984.1 hypothetical protein H180DRAFT_01229 [Streptomyces sp. WMMB 322]